MDEDRAREIRGQLELFILRARGQLERYLGDTAADPPPAPVAAVSTPLDRLVRTLGLTAFERDVLVLCVGAEVAPDFAHLIMRATGEPESRPTRLLALAILADGEMSAFSPSAALRRWGLVRVEPRPNPGGDLRLSIDEALQEFLVGGPLDPGPAWAQALQAAGGERGA